VTAVGKPPREWEESEDAGRASRLQRERAAMRETQLVFAKADEAYRPYGCPASAECCQLTRVQRQPWLWPSEWLVVREALKARGIPQAREDGACPLLDEANRCSIYASRPFGCRTFFCHRITGPSRQPAEEVDALLRRLEHLNQRLEPDCKGPRPLLELFDDARRNEGPR
jgi:Fe-S-cluster containining protein